MTKALGKRLDAAVATVMRDYSGPGGAVAVLREGEVLVRHAFGYANAELRIPFTPRTLFRVCSITKQFTCSLLLETFPDPTVLDGDVRARLPLLEGAAPNTLQLCHNQSGLRDYWAVAMLHGAPAESPFGDREAAAVIGAARTLHFRPGTRYSYCNQNFRILSDIVAARRGRDFAELLRTRVLDRAGMADARLVADTRALPDGAEGYEGDAAVGYRPAVNRILWTGDAGLAASLDDMIAWERHIDAGRDDPAALYNRLAAPVAFADGAPAAYGFGLARGREFGRPVTSHGGGLRGWRSHRLHAPGERISVVVLFNHLVRAHEAALDLFAAALGETKKTPPAADAPAPDWLGAYVEPETGLAVRIQAGPPGKVMVGFGHAPEAVDLAPAEGSEHTRIRREADGLWMDRPEENLSSRLEPRGGDSAPDIAGRYRSSELGAELAIEAAGGVFYGGCSGFLGSGRMERLAPIGRDLWALPCPRALDHTPPGDWTLAFRRDDNGRIASVDVGCWLARGLNYERV